MKNQKIKRAVTLILISFICVFSGQYCYAADKLYGSKIEKAVYKEYNEIYKSRINKNMNSSDTQVVADEVAMTLAEKYRMEPISFAYLVLRVRYNETPPSSYTPPKKPK